MRRKKIYAMAMAVLTVLGTGCGNADKTDGTVAENTQTGEDPAGSNAADPLEASPVPAEEGAREAEGMGGNDPDDPPVPIMMCWICFITRSQTDGTRQRMSAICSTGITHMCIPYPMRDICSRT